MTQNVTRRRVLTVGGATLAGSQWIDVVSAQTGSGNVETETTATIPTDTSISVTVEDVTAGESQTQSITAGTDVITEFPDLSTVSGSGNTVEVSAELSTSDPTVTATMTEPLTLRLPEAEEPAEPSQPVVDGITLPMQIDLGDMQTGVSVFLIGLLGGLMGASALFRNPAAAIMTGLCIVILIAAGLFGFGLELFWLGVILTALLLVVGVAVRWSR